MMNVSAADLDDDNPHKSCDSKVDDSVSKTCGVSSSNKSGDIKSSIDKFGSLSLIGYLLF